MANVQNDPRGGQSSCAFDVVSYFAEDVKCGTHSHKSDQVVKFAIVPPQLIL